MLGIFEAVMVSTSGLKRVEELLDLRRHQDLPLHTLTSLVNNILNMAA